MAVQKNVGDVVTVEASIDSSAVTVPKSDDSFKNTYGSNARIRVWAYPSQQGIPANAPIKVWAVDANNNPSIDIPDDQASKIGQAGQGEIQLLPTQQFNLPANAALGNWDVALTLHKDDAANNFPQADDFGWISAGAIDIVAEEDDMKLLKHESMQVVGGTNDAVRLTYNVPANTFTDDDLILIYVHVSSDVLNGVHNSFVRVTEGGADKDGPAVLPGTSGPQFYASHIHTRAFDNDTDMVMIENLGWAATQNLDYNKGGSAGAAASGAGWIKNAFDINLVGSVAGGQTTAKYEWWVYKLKGA